MNKNEMLKLLKNIQSHLPNVENFIGNEEVDEIESIFEERKELKNQISNLELKLSDDKNYPAFGLLYEISQISVYEKLIEGNESDIAFIDTRMKQKNDSIEVNNKRIADINAKIEEQKSRLGFLERNMNLDSKSEEEKNDLRVKIAILKREIEQKEKKSQKISNKNKEVTNDLNELQQKIDDIKNQLSQNKQEKEKIAIKNKENSLVDIEKKSEDEKKLLELKGDLNAINLRDEFLSYDHAKELSSIISDLKSDKLNNEQLKSRLNDLQNHMSETFVKRNESDQQKDKQRLSEVSGRISYLEIKTSDVGNYYSAIMEKEYTDIYNNILNKISTCETETYGYTNDIIQGNKEIEETKSRIAKLNDEYQNLLLKNITVTGKTMSVQIANEIIRTKSKLTQSESDLEQLKKDQLSRKGRINANTNRITNLTEQSESYKQLKDGIDRQAMLNDQEELFRLMSEKGKLKSKLFFDFNKELSSAIAYTNALVLNNEEKDTVDNKEKSVEPEILKEEAKKETYEWGEHGAAPVVSPDEAGLNPLNRDTFLKVEGFSSPTPTQKIPDNFGNVSENTSQIEAKPTKNVTENTSEIETEPTKIGIISGFKESSEKLKNAASTAKKKIKQGLSSLLQKAGIKDNYDKVKDAVTSKFDSIKKEKQPATPLPDDVTSKLDETSKYSSWYEKLKEINSEGPVFHDEYDGTSRLQSGTEFNESRGRSR